MKKKNFFPDAILRTIKYNFLIFRHFQCFFLFFVTFYQKKVTSNGKIFFFKKKSKK